MFSEEDDDEFSAEDEISEYEVPIPSGMGITNRNAKLPPIKVKSSGIEVKLKNLEQKFETSFGLSDGPTECESHSKAFLLTVDTENKNLNKDLVTLLQAHSNGVPLVISFYPSFCYDQRPYARAYGMFHCGDCLEFWRQTRELPPSCDENALLTEGPAVIMFLTDAAILIDALQWSKRVTSTYLYEALPLLQKATSDREGSRVFRSVLSDVADKTLKGGNFNQTLCDIMRSLRTRLTEFKKTNKTSTMEPADSPANADKLKKVTLVGMRDTDGSFYPGFFSFAQKTKRKITSHSSQNVGLSFDFSFVPCGRIDDDGCYHDYLIEGTTPPGVEFPKLNDVIKQQKEYVAELESQDDDLKETYTTKQDLKPQKTYNDSSRFIFVKQAGPQIHLKEVFSTGLWCTVDSNEYYLAGLFQKNGYFKAAYCITGDGCLIPGSTNAMGDFLPFSDYDQDGNTQPVPESFSSNSAMFILAEKSIKDMPKCPTASEIESAEYAHWVCVKDMKIANPWLTSITSYNISYKTKYFSVYVGGEMGAQNCLYFYRNYDKNRSFRSGISPVESEVCLKEIPDDASSENSSIEEFSSRSGIRLYRNFKSTIKSKDNESSKKSRTNVNGNLNFVVLKTETSNTPQSLTHNDQNTPPTGHLAENNEEPLNISNGAPPLTMHYSNKTSNESIKLQSGNISSGFDSDQISLKSANSSPRSDSISKTPKFENLKKSNRYYFNLEGDDHDPSTPSAPPQTPEIKSFKRSARPFQSNQELAGSFKAQWDGGNKRSNSLPRSLYGDKNDTSKVVMIREVRNFDSMSGRSTPSTDRSWKSQRVLNPAVKIRTGKPQTGHGSLSKAAKNIKHSNETAYTSFLGDAVPHSHSDVVTHNSPISDVVTHNSPISTPRKEVQEQHLRAHRKSKTINTGDAELIQKQSKKSTSTQAKTPTASKAGISTLPGEKGDRKVEKESDRSIQKSTKTTVKHRKLSHPTKSPEEPKLVTTTGMKLRKKSVPCFARDYADTPSSPTPRTPTLKAAKTKRKKSIKSPKQKTPSNSKINKEKNASNTKIQEAIRRQRFDSTLQQDLNTFSELALGPRRSSTVSEFKPNPAQVSTLSFTESYRFSYFDMPDYIAEYNKRIRKGSIKLPRMEVQKFNVDVKPVLSKRSSKRLR